MIFAVSSLAVGSGMVSGASALENQAEDKLDELAPLHMLVSLDDQKIDVYRGGELIRTSPISSGKKGYSTPTGVFSILEKRRRHFSNLYDDAPMPYMQRLTWSGVALHQGHLPGYPASHGCVRMPRDFAKDLFALTKRGAQVIVTNEHAEPRRVDHPVLPQPYVPATTLVSLSPAVIGFDAGLRGSLTSAALQENIQTVEPNPYFEHPLRMIITPNKPINKVKTVQRLLNRLGYRAGPVDGVIGRKTRAAIALFQEGAELPINGNMSDFIVARIFQEAGYEKPLNATLRVRRKFREVYSAPVFIENPDVHVGTHVFTALGFKEGEARVSWISVRAEDRGERTPHAILDRVDLPEKVRKDLGKILTPGTSLIITERSFKRHTDLGTDFVVMTR
ncbi:L,D-transpeptidase [Roseibium hamelinense]|nr:L,D-transpeptidase family protein [Roseibium hamelinense]MTI42286.1 L,D-transpeptidase [Roseibium hamelinense]